MAMVMAVFLVARSLCREEERGSQMGLQYCYNASVGMALS
jgi:hypothetical protein